MTFRDGLHIQKGEKPLVLGYPVTGDFSGNYFRKNCGHGILLTANAEYFKPDHA